jgi:hypothetical protein
MMYGEPKVPKGDCKNVVKTREIYMGPRIVKK